MWQIIWPENRHVSVVHKKEKPFLCPTCPKAFSRKMDLKRHMGTVHKEDCDQSFDKIVTYNITFVCALCGTSFDLKSVLATHVESAH